MFSGPCWKKKMFIGSKSMKWGKLLEFEYIKRVISFSIVNIT